MADLQKSSKRFQQGLGINPERIARLDRFVAKPLCAFLTLFESLRRFFVRKPSAAPERIVFVKLIEMGATVIACPAFAEAVRQVGKENVFILVFAQNRAIVDVLPHFVPENVITVDDRSLLKFSRDLLRALRRIRKEKIDTAIDMEGLTSSSAIITYLTGARNRVGFYNFTSQGPFRGRLFTRELNYTLGQHMGKTFLALTRAATAPLGQVPLLKEPISDDALQLPEFVPDEEEVRHVRTCLKAKIGRDPQRIALLNPNCSDLLPLRRWPEERFVELGKRVLGEFPEITLAVTGAPSEQYDAARIASAMGPPERVASLAGHTTLRQLLALYCISDVLISNDSGPVHFAALTPIPVIALFGPETPKVYGPLGGRARTLTADLACSPCVNMLNHQFSPCHDNRCMQAIEVEDVLDVVREVLRSEA